MTASSRLFKIGGIEIFADLTEDRYGEGMWVEASHGRWEVATLGFVLAKSQPGTLFIDVGAASGIFTLLAAKQGAHVISLEPHPVWARILRTNVALNDLDNVEIREVALSDFDGLQEFDGYEDKSILSPTVVDEGARTEKAGFEVVSLPSLLADVQDIDARNLIVKMDIEGAEFRVLFSSDNLKVLASSRATLFLSLHPGFPHQIRTRNRFILQFSQILELVLGVTDNYRLFSRLRGIATVTLPNGRRVRNALEFLSMGRLGVHDFIVTFEARD